MRCREKGANQDQDGGGSFGLKEFFFLQDPGIKTETYFQGRRLKDKEFFLEMRSPGVKCLHCDLEETRPL